MRSRHGSRRTREVLVSCVLIWLISCFDYHDTLGHVYSMALEDNLG